MSFLSHINPFKGRGHNPLDPTNAINAIKQAEEAAKDEVEKAVKPVLDKAKDEVEKEFDNYVKPQIDKAVSKITDEVKKDLQPVLDKVEDEIKPLLDDLEGLVAKAMLALGEQAAKPTFALAAKLWPVTVGKLTKALEKNKRRKAELNKVPFIVTISAGVVNLGFYWHGLLSRSDTIQDRLHYYSQHDFGKTRSEIISSVGMLAPDAIDFDAGGKLSLGIQIGARAGLWGIPTDIALEALDEVLRAAGVPE